MRLLAAALLAAPLLAVQDGEEGERLARFQRYLERSPYHEQVFRGLVEAARGSGSLGALVEDYRERVSRTDASSDRVVLARLLVELGEHADAAEQLSAVEPPTAEAHRLRARLLARTGRLPEASQTLEAALALATDAELLRDLHLERADLFLARGLPQRARSAYADLARLPDQTPLDQADLAALMADAGFPADGVELLESLLEETSTEVPRTAQLLAQLGQLRETARDGAGALTAYEQALGLLRQGHWLRRDLLARSLDLHRRGGTLRQAADGLRSELAEHPADLEARLSLVAALRLLKREREAAEALAAATELHPEDLRLSDELVVTLRALEDQEGIVRELQRALEHAPLDLQRRLELGRALAELGRLEAAEREWSRLLEAAPLDAPRAERVAREWLRLGETLRAEKVLRAAIAAAPEEARRHGDLARVLLDQGDVQAARQVLGAAERAVAGRPSELDELAELYLEQPDLRSARRVLELARSLDPGSTSRLQRLAQVQADLGEAAAAARTLLDWLDLSADEEQRALACESYSGLFEGASRVAETERLHADLPHTRGGARYLVLAHFRREAGQPLKAAALLETHLQRTPADHAARIQLARDLARGQRFDRALAAYDEVIEREPRRAAELLLEQVRMLGRRGDLRLHDPSPEVLGRLERLRNLPPSDAGTWRELAAAYLRLAGSSPHAADCLAQALRLEPEDGPAHLDLARLLRQLQRTDEAAWHYRLAWKHGTETTRTRALAELHELLVESQELHGELRRLTSLARRDPFDAETPHLLAELSLAQGEPGQAARLLTHQLRREGAQADLLRLRVTAYLQQGRTRTAIADLRALVELGEDVDHLAVELATPAVAAGGTGLLHDLTEVMLDPTPLARALARSGRPTLAVQLLEHQELRSKVLVASASLYLAELQESLGHPRQALRVLERHVEAHGPDWRVTQRMGNLAHELGDSRRALELGRRMLEEGAPDTTLEAYFDSKASREDLTRLRTRELLRSSHGPAAIQAGLAELSRNLYDAPLALDLLDSLRTRASRAGEGPGGLELQPWLEVLTGWTLRFYQANPRLVPRRLEELARRRATLDGHLWVEGLWLEDLWHQYFRASGGDGERRPLGGERALQAHPQDPAVLAAVARWAREQGEGELALEAGSALVRRLAEPGAEAAAVVRRTLALERAAAAGLENLPSHPDLGPATPLALRLARLTLEPGEPQGPVAVVPSRLAATRAHARDLLQAGRREEAAALVQALPEPEAEALLARTDLVRTRIEVGLLTDALERVTAIAAVRNRLADTAPLDTFPGWRREVDLAVAEACGAWLWTSLRGPLE